MHDKSLYEKKSLKELLKIYPEWIAYIKFFEGVAGKDMMKDNKIGERGCRETRLKL